MSNGLTWRYLLIAAALVILILLLVRKGGLKGIGPTEAVLYMVTVDASLNVFSAQNSSPQTTELFAKDRKATLMKYVWIGDATTLALGIFASVIAGSYWPLLGAVTVAVFMHFLYVHAARKGSSSGEQQPAGSKNGGLALVGG